MASIYAYLTPEDKAEMELMWEAMFEALSALYYNLSQSTMSMMLGRSRGYFESSHQEIPLYLSGQTKTIKPDFMLNEDVISQVCHFNSQLYLLTEQAVYTSSDDKFLEEYGTNDNIDTLTRLVYTGGQKYLIGLSGVYAYETDT